MTQFYIENNTALTTIPDWLPQMRTLKNLGLSSNAIRNIPASLWQMPDLETLTLNNNPLNQALPAEISMPSLTQLFLYESNLNGRIPTSLGRMTRLTNLALYGNALQGPIPAELGNLKNLTYLGVHQNQLTGPIPPEIGNLPEIDVLSISSNDLEGTIPSTFANLRNMSGLFIDANPKLTGPLDVLANLPNLTLIRANDCSFTGNLNAFANNTILNWLYISNNQIQGEVPATFARGLEEFTNENNCLNGTSVQGVQRTNCNEFVMRSPPSNNGTLTGGNGGSGGGLSGGLIAGIVIAAVTVLASAGLLVYWLRFRKGNDKKRPTSSAPSFQVINNNSNSFNEPTVPPSTIVEGQDVPVATAATAGGASLSLGTSGGAYQDVHVNMSVGPDGKPGYQPTPIISAVGAPSTTAAPVVLDYGSYTSAPLNPASIPILSTPHTQSTTTSISVLPTFDSSSTKSPPPAESVPLLPQVDSFYLEKKNPSTWTLQDVQVFLQSNRFDQVVMQAFIHHEIDGPTLLRLDSEALRVEMPNVSLRNRLRLVESIQGLCNKWNVVYEGGVGGGVVISPTGSLRHSESQLFAGIGGAVAPPPAYGDVQ
ncbi:polar growth protein [Chytridiales sp. JEL 0842]|nr:polar growth protein [Chytridiales sp. JEL 0842]